MTLTTEGVDYATLMMVSNVNPPATWLMMGNAYSIAPDSLVFSSPATLSFAVPQTGGDYAYFIAQLQGNEWDVVPSSAGTSTIDADISTVGTYALMAYRPESTIPPTTGVTAAGQATAAEGTVTMQGTPKVASIAQAQTPAAAVTKSPLDVMVLFGALASAPWRSSCSGNGHNFFPAGLPASDDACREGYRKNHFLPAPPGEQSSGWFSFCPAGSTVMPELCTKAGHFTISDTRVHDISLSS